MADQLSGSAVAPPAAGPIVTRAPASTTGSSPWSDDGRVELFVDVVEQYRDFAAHAVESPCFHSWASSVVEDHELLAWIADLPPIKQQPNLVFAAARWHGVPAPGPYRVLREALLGDDGQIRQTILERRTQTNEPGRLATLMPVLAQVAEEADSPLALVELGASAGLCLFPDRFDYDWDPAGRLVGSGGPILRCITTGRVPVPRRYPDIAWRCGVDLNPLDLSSADAVRWLEILVWPEQEARRGLLRAAIEAVRADPPTIVRGDLLDELPALVQRAAAHGQVVVQHSAVIAYLELPQRQRFAAMMGKLVSDGECRWVSNEGSAVLPEVTAAGPRLPAGRKTFVLGLDGRALAWTHSHGASMTWVANDGPATELDLGTARCERR